MRLGRSDDCGLRHGLRIGRGCRLRRILHRVAHHAYHALGDFKFLVLRREGLVFEPEEIAGSGRQLRADLAADAR